MGNSFVNEEVFAVCQKASLRQLSILDAPWFWPLLQKFWGYSKKDMTWLERALKYHQPFSNSYFFEKLFLRQICILEAEDDKKKRLVHEKTCRMLRQIFKERPVLWAEINPSELLKFGGVRIQEEKGMRDFLEDFLNLRRWDEEGFWAVFSPFYDGQNPELDRKWSRMSPEGTSFFGRGDFCSDLFYFLSEQKSMNFLSVREGFKSTLPEEMVDMYQKALSDHFAKFFSRSKDQESKKRLL